MGTAFSLLLARNVDTDSEDWRHECECRWLARMSRTQRHERHAGIVKKRGNAAGERIKTDVMMLLLLRELWRMTDDQIVDQWGYIQARYGEQIAARAWHSLCVKRQAN